MYIDQIKNSYAYAANAPYLVQEFPRDVVPPDGYTFGLAAELKELFDKLRKSRPGWKLKITGPAPVSSGTFVRRVEVWSGDNCLGKVWLERIYHQGAMVSSYCFTNTRVDRSLKRRSYKTTIKKEVAAKNILQTFFEETFQERMTRITPNVRQVFTDGIHTAERPYRLIQPSVTNAALQFVEENWEAFIEKFPRLDKDLQRKYNDYKSANVARGRPVTYVHQLPNGEWAISKTPKAEDFPRFVETHSSDPRTFLTDAQFLSLTMLRLQDTSRFVPDHGTKIDDVTFALVS